MSNYNKFKIKYQPDFNVFCAPKEYTLSKPQQFVAEYMKNHNSLLLFHQIGSGKTCAGINIAMNYIGKRKIYFVVPASLKLNVRGELRSKCPGDRYMTDKERKVKPSDSNYMEVISKSDAKIDKDMNILSYEKFVSMLKSSRRPLDDALLIIDEVQNVVSEDGDRYTNIKDAIYKANNLKIVIMSATPIYNNPMEIALTMNLILPEKKRFDVEKFEEEFYKLKSKDKFIKRVNGYVSYYKGAPSYTFPEKRFEVVELEMSPYQGQEYIKQRRFDDFRMKTRGASNIASDVITQKVVDDLEKYSIKYFTILESLRKTKGPAFIYSAFKEGKGINALLKILDMKGYKSFTEHGAGKKRYAVWSGDTSLEDKSLMKTIYNQDDNIDGSKIRIMIGTPAIKEGVSLLNVRHVHIIEPYWNMSRISQVVGRAIRFCAHKALPISERFVNVYMYIATYKKIITSDVIIYERALKKQDLIERFEGWLKEGAIDCTLNKLSTGNITCYNK